MTSAVAGTSSGAEAGEADERPHRVGVADLELRWWRSAWARSTATSRRPAVRVAAASEPPSSSIRRTTSWTVVGMERAVSRWPPAVKETLTSGSPSEPSMRTTSVGEEPVAAAWAAASETTVPSEFFVLQETPVSLRSPCAVVAVQ